MVINKQYISNNNSYENVTPKWIVIHNTDNPSAGACNHAKAQCNGNFKGYSAHVYVDDKEAYQATPFNRGCWHVGVNYGGSLFGTVNNRNSIGIEICNHTGCNYEKAFANGVEVCKQLMKELGIDADHVVSHWCVCRKNCPSTIRAKGDWTRFKNAISGTSTSASTSTATTDKLYRIRKSWTDSKSQLGAYKSLDNAIKDCKSGYKVYDSNGKQVYPKVKTKCSTVNPDVELPMIQNGSTGAAVKVLQTILGTPVTGTFNDADVKSFKEFQKNTNQTADGVCGKNGWDAICEHLCANTYKS